MRKYYCLLLLLMAGESTPAQENLKARMESALDSFSYYQPQEKSQLFTDRDNYMSGETIWFKSWVTLNGLPTVLSKLVYTEMADVNGKNIEKNLWPLTDAAAEGNIGIPKELPSGDYYLRCYTLWMLNFPSFITEKKIRVWNPFSNQEKKPTAAKESDLLIRFFPEGGNLVNGIKSKLAFKATDGQGDPVSVAGDVLNNRNEKIASLLTTHDGMGSFELAPVAGETYKARVSYANGIQKTIELPVALDEGVVLNADNSNPAKTFLRLDRSDKNKNKYNNLYVAAQINYQLVYLGKFNLDDGLDAAAINKKNLAPGIMVISVLQEDGKPIAERLVFVSNQSPADLTLKAKMVNTGSRQKNSLELDASAFRDLDAAVSVVNAENGPDPNGATIISNLLLSSDIKGHIHDPGWYFKDKEPGTLEALDLVMLTHGWRRYNTDDLLSGRYAPIQYPFETSLHISGKVLQSNGKTPLQSGRINLILKGEDSTTLLSEAKTDPKGRFVVDGLFFKKMANVYYQGTNAGRTEAIVSVTVDSAYYDTLKRTRLLYTTNAGLGKAGGTIQQLLQQQAAADTGKGKLLQEVRVKGRKRSEADSLNQVYATDIFYNSDQTLAINHNFNYNDIWQYLRMAVPGILINQTDTGTAVSFSRYDGLDFFSVNAGTSSVQFFLNEVAVNISFIETLDPSDVAVVKIYKGATAMALGADRGAIAIYTEKGKSGRDWRQRGFDFFRRYGYSDSREFFHMDYSVVNPANPTPDLRPTLYWNPKLAIVNGKAEIRFYNDDACHTYRVIIEGIDKDGKLLRVEKEMR